MRESEIETLIRYYKTSSKCLSSLLGKSSRVLLIFLSLESMGLTVFYRGLAWHTDENALRQKFEEFGAVEEAVGSILQKLLTIRSQLYRSLSRIVTPDAAVVSVSFVTAKRLMPKLLSTP